MGKINFLILGSGIQEHALAWKLRQSALLNDLYAIPGNDRMSSICKCEDISSANLPALIKFIEEKQISLIFIGEQSFLQEEMLEYLRDCKIELIAPERKVIGSSRVELITMLRGRGVPLPASHVFENVDGALSYCERHSFPLVIKTDRMGYLKSAVCQNLKDVDDYLSSAMQKFSSDNQKVIVENYISAPAVGVSIIIANNEIMTLPYCQLLREDYRIIGACVPASIPEKAMRNIERLIVVPLVHVLNDPESAYRGIATLEIALTPKGPYLLDWCPQWTPVTAAILMSNMQTDVLEFLLAVAQNDLCKITPRWAAASVALTLSATNLDRICDGVAEKLSPTLFCNSALSTVGIAANGENVQNACKQIMDYWENNAFPENYDLYTALQIARESEKNDV